MKRGLTKAWMAGAADVIFPHGTYWMRRFAPVVCDADEAMRAVPATAAMAAGSG